MLSQVLGETPYWDTQPAFHRQFGRKATTSDWSPLELKDAFLQRARLLGQPLCTFLDGLDEFDPKEEYGLIFSHIEELSSLPFLKLVVSSRPEVKFQNRFKGLPQLKLQDLTAGDIARYVTDKFDAYASSYALDPPLGATLDRLQKLVIRKGEGVFLWVYYALNQQMAGLDNCAPWSDHED